MALLYHPRQRVPVRRWGLPLPACKETAPRFQFAFIQCVTLGPYLEYDGVNAVLLQLVELVGERSLHFLSAHAEELAVYTLNPSSPEFAFGEIV